MAERWTHDAARRIAEFIERDDPVEADIAAALSFAKRLEIDPFDVAAVRYEVGEWLARIALSQTRPDHLVVATYRVVPEDRIVRVTAVVLLRAPVI